MDIVKLSALKFPLIDKVREKINNLPSELYEYIENLQQRLYKGWDIQNYPKAFQGYQADPLFLYIFGKPDYVEKIENLIGLPEEIDFLERLEAMLSRIVKERVPKKGFRRALYKRTFDVAKGLHAQTKFDKFRVDVGVFGLRQIAIEMKKFLRAGYIQLNDEELEEMRQIFLGDSAAEKSKQAETIKRLVYDEFKNNRDKEYWFQLYKTTDDPFIKEWARKRISYPEHPRLVKAYSRIRQLEAIAREQPLTTQLWWKLKGILDGTSEDVKWWRRDLWRQAVARQGCIVCNEPARYVCSNCDDKFCELHL